MQNNKSETLNLRISPQVKDAIRLVADHEHRSMGNLIEVLVFEYCEKHGLPIPSRTTPRRPPARKED